MGIANYFKFNVVVQPDLTNPNQVKLKYESGQHALFAGGLVIDMSIGVDKITREISTKENDNPERRKILPIRALLDSGCTVTSIDKNIIEQLQLKPIGYGMVATANGLTNSTSYLISLNFPSTNLRGRDVHKIGSVDLTNQPFQALIGRDLMANWLITYNGIAGTVSIAD